MTTTLGPKGRNVALDKKWGAPTVTHDGVTVAKDIELKDPFENMGAQLLKEAATKTNDVAGDGTTTATVLAQAIVNEGLRNVAAGANPMLLKHGLDKGVARSLAENGIPISAIAGTSMGALIGGLSAAGYRPDEIEKIFLANDWNTLFKDTPVRSFLTQEQKEGKSRHLLEFAVANGHFMPPSGLSAGQKLATLLTAKTLAASFEANLDFNRLTIPFRAVATDIETGKAVVLDHHGWVHGNEVEHSYIGENAEQGFKDQPAPVGFEELHVGFGDLTPLALIGTENAALQGSDRLHGGDACARGATGYFLHRQAGHARHQHRDQKEPGEKHICQA